MKFCENCGTQLEDSAVFCEECGTKQEVIAEPQNEPTPANIEADAQPVKLSQTCKPAKREIAGWLMTVLLILCSPLVLFEIILFLPDFLFWFLWSVTPIAVLILMWTKRSWKTWLKAAWTIAYVIMFFI